MRRLGFLVLYLSVTSAFAEINFSNVPAAFVETADQITCVSELSQTVQKLRDQTILKVDNCTEGTRLTPGQKDRKVFSGRVLFISR